MRFEFKPSFDRSIKSLPLENKQEIKTLCLSLVDLIEGHEEMAKGIGLKNLRDDYWEIRKGLKFRILFKWRRDSIEFVLAGNHDQMRMFLRNI